MIELKYIKNEEENIEACEKQLDEKLEKLKDQLVMLQQQSKIIYTEDESLKRHMREEQECIQCDEKTKQEKRKMEIGITIQILSKS